MTVCFPKVKEVDCSSIGAADGYKPNFVFLYVDRFSHTRRFLEIQAHHTDTIYVVTIGPKASGQITRGMSMRRRLTSHLKKQANKVNVSMRCVVLTGIVIDRASYESSIIKRFAMNEQYLWAAPAGYKRGQINGHGSTD